MGPPITTSEEQRPSSTKERLQSTKTPPTSPPPLPLSELSLNLACLRRLLAPERQRACQLPSAPFLSVSRFKVKVGVNVTWCPTSLLLLPTSTWASPCFAPAPSRAVPPSKSADRVALP